MIVDVKRETPKPTPVQQVILTLTHAEADVIAYAIEQYQKRRRELYGQGHTFSHTTYILNQLNAIEGLRIPR